MSSFKVLDSLETRIANAHAAIDAHKRKLDTINKWIALKEENTRLWRKRVRAARKLILISVLVLILSIFLFQSYTGSDSTTSSAEDYYDEPYEKIPLHTVKDQASFVKQVAMMDPAASINQDAPLDEIVSWLEDINN